MSNTLAKSLKWLSRDRLHPLLAELQHGLEKEGLRVNPNTLELAETQHPQALGSALTHGHITTDYSEALLEFITPVFPSAEQALDFLANLHRYTYARLGDEQLWCGSMPSNIPDAKTIPIARYGSSNVGQLKHVYRVGLEHRYGKMMQTIAGIHYNFSLPDKFWSLYQEHRGNQDDLQTFRSSAYFSLIRNFRRYSWLLIYLFGASPALCSSFLQGREHQLQTLTEGTLHLPYATSLRMSDLGYSNKAQADLNICFNHLDTYANSLKQAINTPYPAYQELGVKVDGEYRQLNANVLQIENEYYSDIRPKRITRSGEKPVDALIERGVEYIEVRNTDINPFLPLGIDQQQSDFIDLFLISCLMMEDKDIPVAECEEIAENHQRTVTRGRQPGLTLLNQGNEVSLQQWGLEVLEQLSATAKVMDLNTTDCRYSNSVIAQREKLANPALTPSAQVLTALTEHNLSYGEFISQQSALHKQTLMQEVLGEEVEAKLEQLTKNSIAEQDALEKADNCGFDQYLADYLAS